MTGSAAQALPDKTAKGTPCGKKVKIRPRGYVGIAAMVEIARSGQKPVPLYEAAATIGVSVSYLEQLSRGLRGGGLVSSSRGPGGGYRLAKPARTISALEIILSVERTGVMRRKAYHGPRSARKAQAPFLRDMLESFQYLLLQHISLADMASASLDDNPFLKTLFEMLGEHPR